MNFDKAIEKIESAKDITAVNKIVENTNSRDKDAVLDYARVLGWEV